MHLAQLEAVYASNVNLRVTGKAGNGLELLAQLLTTPADVLVLDVNIPGLGGIKTAVQLRVHYPAVQVLALTRLDETACIF